MWPLRRRPGVSMRHKISRVYRDRCCRMTGFCSACNERVRLVNSWSYLKRSYEWKCFNSATMTVRKRPRYAYLDRLFSAIIKILYPACVSCYGTSRDFRLECAHVYGRSEIGLRWDLDNAVTLCKTCHEKYTRRPRAWIEFCKRFKSTQEWDRLQKKRRELRTVKLKIDFNAVHDDLKRLLARLQGE